MCERCQRCHKEYLANKNKPDYIFTFSGKYSNAGDFLTHNNMNFGEIPPIFIKFNICGKFDDKKNQCSHVYPYFKIWCIGIQGTCSCSPTKYEGIYKITFTS